MAQFEKGKSGNPSGRPPGIRNKTSEQIRTLIKKFLAGNLNRLQKDFDALESPKERLMFVEKFLRLVIPPPVNELEKLDDESLDRLIEKLKKREL
jgi:hypothetical protein